ncbi:MAG: flagellar basal body L-ring protein FlgH [Steroidobacteraceae bacterium]
MNSEARYALFASLWMLSAMTCPATLRADAATEPMYRSLYADRKAYRAGDILTVVITESASASATARTRADKADNVRASIEQSEADPWNIQLDLSNDFSGGGEIQRTGRLLARLAVFVEGVDQNGNLQIRGEQNIKVNNEKQRIALTGIVRLEDITPDNTVASWRIAAADIDFIGKGILARKQSPGLMAKLFDLFGLN